MADGAITIRDQANQQQNVADLSRDVENANDAISPIFNKEKEQNRLQTVQLMGEIGMQVSDIVKTQGAIEAAQKANSQMAGVTQAQKDEALKALQAQDRNKQYSDKEINQQVWQNFYDNAQKNSDYGTGGKYQRAVQAVTAAVQGLAGGDVQSALAGGAAPYLADVIGHKLNLDEGSKAIAHAIAGAVVAELQGRNALAGAAGAVAGEQAANILLAQMFPGKSAADLTEEEKQTISAFSTLAAGLAGGIAGDSSASVLTGAQAGKNAVENNALSDDEEEIKSLHGNRPIKVIPINPLTPNVLDADGDPLKGGGIGKFTINKGQQNKHLPGTNEYKIASEAGLNKSVLTVAPDSLLPKLGTGQQVGNTPVGIPGSKERINYGQNIGNYIDPQTGVSIPTTNGIVHYGKNGVHIVPARPSE